MRIAHQTLTADKLQDTISKFWFQAPIIVVHPTDVPKVTAMFSGGMFTRAIREDRFMPAGKVCWLDNQTIRVFDLK